MPRKNRLNIIALCFVLAGLPIGSVFAATAPLPVYHTSGRFLLDPCNDTVIIRGVELPVNHREYIPEVAKTGANFVRILVTVPPADYPTSYAEIDSILAFVKRSGMAADIMVNNNTASGGYVIPEVMTILKKYEDILSLHAMGEGQQTTDAQWLSECKATITMLRNAGYRCPLYMLSTSSGRDPNTVLKNGKELVDFDPLHNILCGVQLYWGYTSAGAKGWWLDHWGFTDKDAIDSFSVKNFPIVAGINNHDPYGDPWLDYETQLSETQAKKISWFWWDWCNPWSSDKYHLSTTGKYGDWGVLAAGGPDLDKITITGSGVATASYEAESYTSDYDGGWGKISHTSVSGGEFLCCSNVLNDWLEWNQISGGTAGGTRTVTFKYSNGDDNSRRCKVMLNGDSVATLTFGNSGPGANDANFWRVWKDESVTLTLRSGMNTVRLVAIDYAGCFNPNYGYRTVISHPASIKNTSKRTSYMVNHACGGTPVVDPVAPVKGRDGFLSSKGTMELLVTDITGKLVMRSGKIDQKSATALLRGLPSGVFLIHRIDASRQSIKMTIMR